MSQNFWHVSRFLSDPFHSKIIVRKLNQAKKINLTHFRQTAPLKTGQNARVGQWLYIAPPLICRIVDLTRIYDLKFKYGTSFLNSGCKMDQIWLKNTKNHRKYQKTAIWNLGTFNKELIIPRNFHKLVTKLKSMIQQ